MVGKNFFIKKMKNNNNGYSFIDINILQVRPEILAGIFKEIQILELVGVKTYGKGVVQGLFTLPDQSGLKLTIEEYFTQNIMKLMVLEFLLILEKKIINLRN